MHRRPNPESRRRPEAMARRRSDEGHFVIQQIVRSLVASRWPESAEDRAALRAEMTMALREALNGQSPAPPAPGGWGSAADMIRLVLLEGGFDLTDPHAVEGW